MKDSDGLDLQFLVDSTFKAQVEPYQIELICLSILNASMISRNGIPHVSKMSENAEQAYRVWETIKLNRLGNELKQSL